ncbi:MAG: carbonic anhydrase [Phycisphaerales bacterium]
MTHATPTGRTGADSLVRYRSPVAYEQSRIHAAAVYCSDGRVGEQFDDFLQNGLSLPRYDRVSLPGGPACLAGHPQAHLEEQGVVDELKFLVEVHKLKRVVLIAHQGCAFYSTRLDLREPRLELVQRADLVRAAAYVHRVTGLESVDAYFARLIDGRVSFEHVEV